MALKLYRRHRKECEGAHPEDERTGHFEEGRRGWKKCACLIHASGTLAGRFSRRQTGKADWDEAKAVAAVWEEAGSWDGRVEPAPPETPAPVSGRFTIDEAVSLFLSLRKGDKIAPPRSANTKPSPSSLLPSPCRAAT